MTDEAAQAAKRKRLAEWVEREFGAGGGRCHTCGAPYTADGLVDGLLARSVGLQTFTGRAFCYPGCWEEYRRREGL